MSSPVCRHPNIPVQPSLDVAHGAQVLTASFHRWSESEEFKDKIYFAKFDVDDLPDLAQDLGIRAMPTFIFFKDGDKVGDFLGANPPALLNLLKQQIPAGAVQDTTPTDKPDAMKAAEEAKEAKE